MDVRSVEMKFAVPEQISWETVALLFGDQAVREMREGIDDIERFENEGGPCVE